MKCRFCKSDAIAIVALSDGCACHPEDREQGLCPQHLSRATPRGSLAIVEWLDEYWCKTMGLYEPNRARPM